MSGERQESNKRAMVQRCRLGVNLRAARCSANDRQEVGGLCANEKASKKRQESGKKAA
jgi:hypothetical protein